MQVGGTQIVVMAVSMMIIMVMSMVRMVVSQQPRTDQIDRETNNGDGNRLRETNRNRIGETHETLPADEHSDQCKHDRACKGGKIAEFSGPERNRGLRAFFRAYR